VLDLFPFKTSSAKISQTILVFSSHQSAKLLPTKSVTLKWNAYQGAAKASNIKKLKLDTSTGH
jgi:hypothetical protein